MRGKPLSAKARHGYQPVFFLLRERGISQREAAGHVRVSQGGLNGYLTGFIVPPAVVAERLSGMLGLPVDDLFSPDVLRLIEAKSKPRSRA